jgi:L-ascorbate metabolism protein UlaG (beta-lactamase superfamily)
VTFINHATVLIEAGGSTFLTDPVYSLSISYFIIRLRRPGVRLRDLPPIDFVLLSHGDYDHLNLKTLRRLRRRHQSVVLTPSGIGDYAHRAGFSQVVEMQWGERFERDDVGITCVPAKHANHRFPWSGKNSFCCGFTIEAGGKCVYFAGDTGYSEHFKTLGDKQRIDVALLPIGAYKPYEWFKDIHLNPATAVQALIDLNARYLVPIHWGTFKISDEPMAEPPQFLQTEAHKRGIGDRIKILHNGDLLLF